MFGGVKQASSGRVRVALCGIFFLIFALAAALVPSRADASPAAIVVDADTGTVLYDMNSQGVNYPASLTKMMTLYLLFEAIEAKRVKLDDQFTASDYAASQPATDISLKPGDQISVEKAIEAIIVQSANDVAVVVGESLGGSEDNFARLMTAKAKELGMTGTVFRNASGLPDPNQITNARDMSLLARALIARFPNFYPYFSIESFSYQGRVYLSHNRVLKSYPGADGLKTGYTRASGYNLATSAMRDGHRIVAVVLGGKSARKRDLQMVGLLDQGFRIVDKTPATQLASAQQLNLPVAPVADTDAAASTTPAAGIAAASAKPDTLNLELASETDDGAAAPDSGKMAPGKDRWGVQVGAFGAYKPAHTAALRASRIAPKQLKNAHVIVDEAAKGANRLYRARLIGLTKQNAQLACRQLKAKSVPCLVFQADVTVAMNAGS